ncbi:MAG: tetratricopeptide repeat protein [Pirellulales bacterium]|nr:tetratricopeptide repeat protein [Pirellulales bacterium]
MDRSERVARYQQQSPIADDMAERGNKDEALRLLESLRDEAAAAGDKDYEAFFDAEWINYSTDDHARAAQRLADKIGDAAQSGGVDSFLLCSLGLYHSQQGDEDAAIAWFDKALEENPKDWKAMRQRGVSLSEKGDEDAAIEWYDKALEENPKDWRAMNHRGASLATKGDQDAAIEWYDKALAENPKDWDAMRSRGVALSNKGDEDAAIVWFDKALEENPEDWDAMWNMGVSLFNGGEKDAAIEWLGKAARQDPSRWEQDFIAACKLAGKDVSEERRKWVSDAPALPPKDPFGELRLMINLIRTRLKEQAARYLDIKKEAEGQLTEFLKPESRLPEDRSLLMVLRKWNSYTPALPASAEDERSRGGGYFIWHQGHGTVIDPGFNFVENFHQAGGRIHDIHNIILTHAHPDHTAEFETLRTLLFEYNDNLRELNKTREAKKLPPLTPKRVRFFLNNGAFRKFAGMLSLREHEFTDRVATLNSGSEFDLLGGGRLRVLPAYHDELLSCDQSVGVLLTLGTADEPRRILLTSDTGLFPLNPESKKPTADASKPELEIGKRYLESVQPGDVDVMLVHIGSIKPDEFDMQKEKIVEACYPNHLGIIGTARVIAMCRPKLAVVSEFGEEMRDFRFDLIKDLSDTVLRLYFQDKGGQSPQVVPGDLAFVYSITDRTVLDCATRDWSPAEKIDFWEHRSKTDEPSIYYAETVPLTDEKKLDNVNLFCSHRKAHDGLYFAAD